MPSKKLVQQTWDKATPIKGKNPDTFRKDAEGNTIRKASYRTQGEYGWEIDHKKPKEKGRTDDLRNSQPLHWEANREKSDKYPKEKN